ncbi:receptor-like kinase TMK4 [Humulus lupulus]|uniref:receptor-like kinase TMK4 n=1 Tax=Humulus lupulus TaxID=3486 RepID=UPI002B410D57|nr:receptor-like kinase TMK4 [Humulus lupulus]
MGLSGTIEVLENMTSLYQVWLHRNLFTGPIPDLLHLDTLFDLQLHDNLLTGIVLTSLSSIPSLRNITLANNKLQGPMPSFPKSVTNVELDGTNSFCKDTPGPCDAQVSALLDVAGYLGYPTVLANSWKTNDACSDWSFVICDSDGNVITVNFQKQRFVGTISPAFANLTSLKNLYLNDNSLTGSIPKTLTLLPQVLDVSNNNLTGEIPTFLTFNVIILMRNDEIAVLLQALDLKWEQREETQLAELKSVINKRLAHVSPPPSPGHGGENSAVHEHNRVSGRRSETDADCRELNSILKTLQVKAPRFDGSEADDWVYKIKKFFDLHRVDPTVRLSVVPFHLDEEPSTWF